MSVLEGHAGKIATSPFQDDLEGGPRLEMQQHEPRWQLVEMREFDLRAIHAQIANDTVRPVGKARAVHYARGRPNGTTPLIPALNVYRLWFGHALFLVRED